MMTTIPMSEPCGFQKPPVQHLQPGALRVHRLFWDRRYCGTNCIPWHHHHQHYDELSIGSHAEETLVTKHLLSFMSSFQMRYFDIFSCRWDTCLLLIDWLIRLVYLPFSSRKLSFFFVLTKKYLKSHIYSAACQRNWEKIWKTKRQHKCYSFLKGIGIEKIQVGESGIAFKTLNARLFTCN